ncbi:hypothetical protein NECAME_15366 [Necator americanus]|nr:hypothetical protein NECAME_15366 [Necator americanus]ETN69348.1 hypothetical protein NECAME_15366 [Necator americanus]
MKKVLISEEPVLKVIGRDDYDAVIVDVGATGIPISDVAKKILSDGSGKELHRVCMFSPYKNGILATSKGKPDVIYVVTDMEDSVDKRVRVGMASGMREAFESGRLKKILAYPFCVPENKELLDFVLQQFLLTSYKAFTWSPKAKTFDGTITLAGTTDDNCAQMRHFYEELLSTEIKPKIDAYESILSSATELVDKNKEKESGS